METSTAWAYLTGVYLGDGCVYNHQGYLVFVLSVKDQDFAHATRDALKRLSSHTVSICGFQDRRFAGAAPAHRLRCGDPKLAQALRDQTDNKQRIPDWLFDAPTEQRLAFVAGLMDSEGYVCLKDNRQGATLGFKSTDVWFEDFLRLLQSLGIMHGKVGVEKPRKPGYRTPRRISIKLASWVRAGAYFRIGRKQERVERWAAMSRYGRPSPNVT